MTNVPDVMVFCHPNEIFGRPLENHLRPVASSVNKIYCTYLSMVQASMVDTVFQVYCTSLCIQLEEVMAKKRNSSMHMLIFTGVVVGQL